MLPELQARDVDGYRLGYREAGQGEALVLFHGLVLWGEEDQRSPLQVAVQLRDAIPKAELAVIPGAGHLSNMEQPEAFNAGVRRFVLSV